MHDVISFTQNLLSIPSVTPNAEDILNYLEKQLQEKNFTTIRLPFSEKNTLPVDNLFATYGKGKKILAFAGHVDVVPPGDLALWTVNPWGGEIKESLIYGRGIVDMKGAIACFISAAFDYIEVNPECSIALLLTGDEEGPAINGTRKMVEWLKTQPYTIENYIVGEPTCPNYIGEMIKIGRRGSISFFLSVKGVQGHVAYPEKACNPIDILLTILQELKKIIWDVGTEHFLPTHLEITTIDVGNPTTNIIPSGAKATFNLRFNILHTSNSLTDTINEICKKYCHTINAAYDLALHCGAHPFYNTPGDFTQLVEEAHLTVLGKKPCLSTTGGTSDARFIKEIGNVVECGLVNEMAHKIDEHCAVEDLHRLKKLYKEIILRYFNT